MSFAMTWRLPNLLAAACLSAEAARITRQSSATSASVATSFGDVLGNSGDRCESWLGIPFAEAPVGELRFANPSPWRRAYPSAGLKAQSPGSICIQGDGSGDEDCLFLNIWRPKGSAAGAKLPVMVWIHGGSFISGAGSEGNYDGCYIASNQDVIVATLNYRLNIFGFGSFAEGDDIDTNWAMEDQREALRWLHREVAAFGGDANKVTLFGESAGGISIFHHLVTARSRGLFRAAIMQSGFPGARELAPALATTREMGARVGCHSEAGLRSCMRGKSAKELQEKDDLLAIDIDMFQRWEPVEDGVELPSHPFKLLAEGKSHDVPIISGSNTNEGTLFTYLVYLSSMSNIQYRSVLRDYWGAIPGKPSQSFDSAEFLALLHRYPGRTFADNRGMRAEVSGDAIFDCATRFGAKLHHQRSSTWTYRFNYRSEICAYPPPFSSIPGVFHAMEISSVFNNTFGCVPEPEAQALSTRMQTYWANFAKYLDPNGLGAPTWPRYTPAAQREIVLQEEDAIESDYKARKCAFWEHTLYSKVL